MQTTLGLFLIVLAGCLQGLFVLPLTFTRRWQWEHSWAAFSLFGMLLFNWLIALVLLPHAFAAYSRNFMDARRFSPFFALRVT